MIQKVVGIEKYQWLERGKPIWVHQKAKEIADVFLEGKVLDINQQKHEILVQMNHPGSGTRNQKIKLEDCYKLTYGETDVSDMVDLEQLNQPELLWNIRRRYLKDLIFTFCGPTLLIINPYKTIDALFNQKILHEYQFQVLSENLEYKSMPPHIYGLACFCLWQLYDNNRNQSIVISGQSGAGKTENTKYCLNFLASLGKNLKDIMGNTEKSKKLSPLIMRTIEKAIKKSGNKAYGIENKILGCNQILEAFGNAKTIRNDNSSRFGKLIMLLYGETPIDIKSAFITNYLLEKSRIVSLAEGERNYHIFYYFLLGASAEEKAKYKLNESIQSYHFLNQSSVVDIGKDNKAMFRLIKEEFELYLAQEEIDAVLRIVAAVLNLGNIRFSKVEKSGEDQVVIEKEQYLRNAAELLSVQPKELITAFTFKERVVQNQILKSPLKLEEVLALRDSLSKCLYEKLFNYLVMKLNQKIQLQKVDSESEQGRRSIGILDIFGFEILGRNSLEQFFINFANQKLQQLYVLYIFKEQKEEFKRQGLKDFATDIGFEDNQPIIDLIEKKPTGLFFLINQSSQLNGMDSMLPVSFLRNSDPKYISKHRTTPELFTIHHSCSPVEYNAIGFTVKNKDEFPPQMLGVVAKINQRQIHTIINFDVDVTEPTNNAHTRTNQKTDARFLGTKFLKQMNKLTDELYKCDCHFVRCIKPNENRRAKDFNSRLMLQSLRNLGVLDSIKIRKLGYVYRKYFRQFYRKFYEIEAYNYHFNEEVADKTEEELRVIVRKFVEKHAQKDLQKNMILIGTKKILVKESSLNYLQSLAKEKRKNRLATANKLKQRFFENKAKNNFRQPFQLLKAEMASYLRHVQETLLKKKVIKVQRAIRKFILQNMYKKNEAMYQKSAIIIGTWWRKVKARKQFLKKRQQAITIQANLRRFLDLAQLKKARTIDSIIHDAINIAWKQIQQRKATKIKKMYKGWVTRIRFKDLIRQIEINKQLALLNMRIIKVQKLMRSVPHQRSFHKFRRATMVIQAHWKRYLIQKVYHRVLASVAVIQKYFRRFLARKYYRQQHWAKFNKHLQEFQNIRHSELAAIGLLPSLNYARMKNTVKRARKSPLEQSSMLPQIASPQETAGVYRVKADASNVPAQIYKQSGLTVHKNDLQCYVLDLDVLGDLGGWGKSFKTLSNDLEAKAQYPVHIKLNQNSTLVASQKCKLYCFGEPAFTVGKAYIPVESIDDPYKIVMSEFQTYVTTLDRRMYVWGDAFAADQLMLGNAFEGDTTRCQVNNYLPMHKISDVTIKGCHKYLVDNQGRAYEYEAEVEPVPGKHYPLKKELQFGERVEVRSVCASNQFVHFLGWNGCVYSKGMNKKGELGLGHTENIKGSPQLNVSLKNGRHLVETVVTGLKHTLVRTKLGYVLGWGDNSFKQVNSSAKPFFSAPQLLDLDRSTNKALHIAAGIRCGVALLDSLRICWWGTNSRLSFSEPIKIELQSLIPVVGGVLPVKVSSCWANNMSVIYANCIRLNQCKKTSTREVILKHARAVSKDWEPQQILPPYSEAAETSLNLVDLKKYKFKPRTLNKGQGASRGANGAGVNNIAQLDLMVELRRNNSAFGANAKQKLSQMFDRLLAKDISDWTEDDKRTYEYLQNPKIQQLIKKL